MSLRFALYRAAGMKIGKGTRITGGFYVDRPDGVIVGENCFFNHYVHLHNGADPNTKIVFGNNIFIGPETNFFCASHDIGPETHRAGKNIYQSITVGDGVWIGANTTIFPGVDIAKGCVIGACSVVTRSTDDNCLYHGENAKLIRTLE